MHILPDPPFLLNLLLGLEGKIPNQLKGLFLIILNLRRNLPMPVLTFPELFLHQLGNSVLILFPVLLGVDNHLHQGGDIGLKGS